MQAGLHIFLIYSMLLTLLQGCVLGETSPSRTVIEASNRSPATPTMIGHRPHQSIHFNNACACAKDGNDVHPITRKNYNQCSNLCHNLKGVMGNNNQILILEIDFPQGYEAVDNIHDWCHKELGDGYLSPDCLFVYWEARGIGIKWNLEIGQIVANRYMIVPIADGAFSQETDYHFKIIENSSQAETATFENLRIGPATPPQEDLFPNNTTDLLGYHCKYVPDNDLIVYQYRSQVSPSEPFDVDYNCSPSDYFDVAKAWLDSASRIDQINQNFLIDLQWQGYRGNFNQALFRPIQAFTKPKENQQTIGYMTIPIIIQENGHHKGYCPDDYQVGHNDQSDEAIFTRAMQAHTGGRATEALYLIEGVEDVEGFLQVSQSWLQENDWYYPGKIPVGDEPTISDMIAYDHFFVDVTINEKTRKFKLVKSNQTRHAHDHRVGCVIK